MSVPEPGRALVTGGSGYFGCLLVSELRKRGYAVSVFDLVDVPDRAPDVRYIQGDIRDRAAVAAACAGVSVVHHNVAQVPLAKDSALFWSVNVDGARNLLEAAREQGVRKTVLVSSSAVYGVPARNPVDASVEPRPREPYGAAKLEAERLAARFVDGGLDVTVIRPRTILGHGRLGIFQILFEWVRRGRPLYVLGRGDNRYQFVHADDLADACIRAGERPGAATYNIGAERFGTMRQALEALARHAGTGSPVRSLPFGPTERLMEWTSALGLSPLGPYHSLMYGREMFFDVRPAEEDLGWRSTRSNDEMLIESYDDYLAHRAEILARRGASHHRSPLRQGILKLLEYLPWRPPVSASSILLAVLTAVLNSAAQLLLRGAALSGARPEEPATLIRSPLFFAALVCYGASVLTWLAVLKKVPLPTAMPFVALAYIVAPLGGRLAFGDPLGLRTGLGMLLVIAGILVVATH